MHIRSMVLALGFLLVLSGCGGEEGGEEDVEPTRCGGIHWSDSAGQDVYTGCQGNDGNWTCVCESDPPEAFQGGTQSNESAASCTQAISETCSIPVPVILTCAGGFNDIGTCWGVADENGTVSDTTFDCRCEQGAETTEVEANSCQDALTNWCQPATE